MVFKYNIVNHKNDYRRQLRHHNPEKVTLGSAIHTRYRKTLSSFETSTHGVCRSTIRWFNVLSNSRQRVIMVCSSMNLTLTKKLQHHSSLKIFQSLLLLVIETVFRFHIMLGGQNSRSCNWQIPRLRLDYRISQNNEGLKRMTSNLMNKY